jgi:signal transduction histidine kinase
MRLWQVLVNLTTNAMEAAESGSRVEWVLGTGNAPDTIQATVRNRGPVIPRAVLARLPKPFYTTKREGTGLGLSIAQRLVERHGGRLAIRSEPELGTEVSFTLPLIPGRHPQDHHQHIATDPAA